MTVDAAAASESTPTGVRVRVLVVDDDVVICRQMAANRSSAGYQVVTAHDGARALAQAEETPPDLAIVDLEMPGTHGLDVINQRAFIEVRVAKEAADRRMAYGAEASALLAHDLNNGLAVSLSKLQYLQEVLTLGADEAEALVTTMRSLQRMSNLVANFVDIARFEDAAVKPMVAATRVHQVLESVLEVSASSLGRGVTITIDCKADLMARFDPALVERVLHNLVGNAARYCNQGGSIVVGARRWNDDDSVEISVTNSGPPIAHDIRPQLFVKYVRGKEGQRGMGLYFCRLVAEAHGGRIDHEPTQIGTRFVVRLPGRA
jgi:signal transduction histidine kinase